MATTAQFTAQPIIDISQVSTANTNRDGTGTIVTVATGPSTTAAAGVGKRINRVVVHATGTTTAGVIRFYISVDGGTTNRLICERLVTATTPSTTIAAFRTEVGELAGLVLTGGGSCMVRASTNNAETFNIMVESGLL
jgi:hypothetical protein